MTICGIAYGEGMRNRRGSGAGGVKRHGRQRRSNRDYDKQRATKNLKQPKRLRVEQPFPQTTTTKTSNKEAGGIRKRTNNYPRRPPKRAGGWRRWNWPKKRKQNFVHDRRRIMTKRYLAKTKTNRRQRIANNDEGRKTTTSTKRLPVTKSRHERTL